MHQRNHAGHASVVGMAEVAFVFSILAVIASVGAWIATSRQAVEAKKANDRADKPHITVSASGRMHAAGLAIEISSDTDLRTIVVSQALGHTDPEQAPFYGLYSWQVQSNVTHKGGVVTIHDPRAGQGYSFQARLHNGQPRRGRVRLRFECTHDDGRNWTVPGDTGSVEIDYSSWY